MKNSRNKIKQLFQLENTCMLLFIFIIFIISALSIFQTAKSIFDILDQRNNIESNTNVSTVESDNDNENTSENNNEVLEEVTVTQRTQSLYQKIDHYNISLKTLIGKVEDLFKESVYKKEEIAKIDIKLKYTLTNYLDSTQVLLGKDNWLFYKSSTDGDSLADYQGKKHYTEEEMHKIAVHLINMEKKLSDKNIKFILMIPPNKEQVYSQYMPDTIIKENDESRTDQLVEYLKENSSLSIVYPKQELIDLSKEYSLYYKYGTHWNLKGSFVGAQQLLDELYNKRSQLKDQIFEVFTTKTDLGLVNMLGIDWPTEDTTEYCIKGYDYIYDKELTNKENSNAKYKDSIVVVGDSFRENLAPYLFKDFKKVTVIYRPDYSADILESAEPNIVVLEFVERYLPFIEDFSF